MQGGQTMPELPDVEVFKQYFDATALHKEIRKVEVYPAQVLKGITEKEMKRNHQGRKFTGTRRHGKYLFVSTDDERWLVFHFGMTGYLKYFKKCNKQPHFDRAQFSFTNGYHLAYVSKRMLGRIEPARDVERFIRKKGLGPDALDDGVDLTVFKEIFADSPAMAKTALMDQDKIAGIGNVYADEILFHSGIRPKRQMKELDDARFETLYDKMKTVLKTAVECRAEVDQFPDDYLLPHRNADGVCPKCGAKIKRIKISNRSAYYCPECQR
jgi:formamidopyrimidine-DNA glycosylase